VRLITALQEKEGEFGKKRVEQAVMEVEADGE
jgi:hypothetical protein